MKTNTLNVGDRFHIQNAPIGHQWFGYYAKVVDMIESRGGASMPGTTRHWVIEIQTASGARVSDFDSRWNPDGIATADLLALVEANLHYRR